MWTMIHNHFTIHMCVNDLQRTCGSICSDEMWIHLWITCCQFVGHVWHLLFPSYLFAWPFPTQTIADYGQNKIHKYQVQLLARPVGVIILSVDNRKVSQAYTNSPPNILWFSQNSLFFRKSLWSEASLFNPKIMISVRAITAFPRWVCFPVIASLLVILNYTITNSNLLQ